MIPVEFQNLMQVPHDQVSVGYYCGLCRAGLACWFGMSLNNVKDSSAAVPINMLPSDVPLLSR